MKTKLSDLWRWDGLMDRGHYAFWGFLLFAVKYNLDRLVSVHFFHRPWPWFGYFVPGEIEWFHGLKGGDASLYGTLLVMSVPFILAGVVITIKRLRSAQMPLGLVLLVFVPVVKLIFFVLLCVLPAKDDNEVCAQGGEGAFERFLDRIMPRSSMGSAALSVLVTVPLAWAAVWLGTTVLKEYGWGLFVGLPFCLGVISALIHGYHTPRDAKSCVGVALLSVVLAGAGLLVLAMEGMVCLVMAAPIWLAFAAMGALIGYGIQTTVWRKGGMHSTLMVVILASPLLMGAERIESPEPRLLVVRSKVEINAKPEKVWRNVIAFADLPPPTELLFRFGIAYPQRAEIQGHGPGALRHCVFSTGAFVEPIEVWDEPRLLKFSVTANPPPMEEWTPYREIHPPHLNGFLVSRGGQFLLTSLPDGRTRLEGTTWYQHNMWPASYWQIWSDRIIHTIHMRVLRHIQRESEQETNSG